MQSTPELVAVLATPSNINRLVGGTTLLHTAAASGLERLVSALLAAGAAAGQQDSRGESVLVMLARQGSTAMLSLLLHRLLWQHKVTTAADSALLPPEVLAAMQQALVHSEERSVAAFTTVMEVLGEGAASALWQKLVKQQRISLAAQGNPGQQQQRQRMGHAAVSALLQGLSSACDALAEQQKSITQPLEQAVQGGSHKPPVAARGSANSQSPPPAAATGGAGAGAAVNGAGGAPAKPRPSTLATISAAARLGQQQEVQGLLQQLPGAAQTAALAEAVKAAGSGGHWKLCGQLVQKLVATDQAQAMQVVQGVVVQLEGRPYTAVEVLGPSSLELCGALLGGWQAVRGQQQQEMVDGVVSAVVAWRPAQLQAQARELPGNKRRHVAPALQAVGGAGSVAGQGQQGAQEHCAPPGAEEAELMTVNGSAAADEGLAAGRRSGRRAPVPPRARRAAAQRTQQQRRRLS
jgi:hypothetical protein